MENVSISKNLSNPEKFATDDFVALKDVRFVGIWNLHFLATTTLWQQNRICPSLQKHADMIPLTNPSAYKRIFNRNCLTKLVSASTVANWSQNERDVKGEQETPGYQNYPFSSLTDYSMSKAKIFNTYLCIVV